jgi:hypothetical protein
LRWSVYIVGYIRGMGITRAWFLLIFTVAHALLFAQNDSVKITLAVTDSYTKRPMPYVSIINPKSSATVTTDGHGIWEQAIRRQDTLFLFYPGYKSGKFSLAGLAEQKEYKLNIEMTPLQVTLGHDVVIKAPKTLEQIEAERKKLGITPKELEKPNVDALVSPISAIYEALSARAKEREKLKGQIEEDERDKVFKELLNYYNERKIIDLPEDHYVDFIKFCNLPTEFLKNHSDYEIMKTITTYYKKYVRLSGLEK